MAFSSTADSECVLLVMEEAPALAKGYAIERPIPVKASTMIARLPFELALQGSIAK